MSLELNRAGNRVDMIELHSDDVKSVDNEEASINEASETSLPDNWADQNRPLQRQNTHYGHSTRKSRNAELCSPISRLLLTSLLRPHGTGCHATCPSMTIAFRQLLKP